VSLAVPNVHVHPRTPGSPVVPVSFDSFDLPDPLVRVLRTAGITTATPIQSAVLADGLAGRDVLGRAATGSGKTLAFGLPLVTRIAASPTRRQPGAPRGLVLVPTRELAAQVTDVLRPLAERVGLSVRLVVGGVGYGPQLAALRKGVDLLVATPGRLEDLIARRACRLDAVEVTVLDEADQMCDLGFLPAVRRLLTATPAGGQRLLFSATLDQRVGSLVAAFLTAAVTHEVAPADEVIGTVTHTAVLLDELDARLSAVRGLVTQPGRSLVFVRTKRGADRLALTLRREGIEAGALHGDLAQSARTKVLARFAVGDCPVLVATDVAARGLHVDAIARVVHADPPTEPAIYVHRSGRTGRAGADGEVQVLVLPEQIAPVRRLLADAGVEVTGLPPMVRDPRPAPRTRSGRRPGVAAVGNAGRRGSSGTGRRSRRAGTRAA
jgi:superfamily II DNA/RNA helicase